jgi:hypothetical protein
MEILNFLAMGMQREMNEVYDLVREKLEEMAEASDDE